MTACRKMTLLLTLIFLLTCARSYLKGRTPAGEEYLANARAFPLEFKVSKSGDYDAWGRAQSFVAKHSEMKMQIISDFVIDTYNPSELRYSYRIIKTPVEDSLAFSVLCISGKGGSPEIALDYAHVCAYYIKTGILPSDLEWAQEKQQSVPLWGIFLGVGMAFLIGQLVISNTGGH